MTKTIKLSTITAIAVFSIIGCGSSSSSDVKTGTGYYVDNAVQGVDYACGSETGKTDIKGTFTFEEGKECKFTLAGIPLRTTKADELVDGKEVFEDNPKVAKFLQSIDANNDLSDGIQITDEVLTALTTALETSNSTGTLPEGTVLTEVVASVGHDVEDVSGDVKTDEEVQEHLAQTQTDITKALLAGKTFYVVGQDNGKQSLFKIIVNKEATSIKSYHSDGTFDEESTIKIIGNKLTFTKDTGGYYSLISQKDGYIFLDDRQSDGTKDGVGHRFYTSESDAQAYFDSVKGDEGSGDDSTSINYTIDDGIPNTKIIFKEADGITNKAVPSDAFIRLVPKTYVDQDNYGLAINCKIQSDGSFENSCFIDSGDKSRLDARLADSTETYQIIIYKNYINSEEKHWECGENTYKYVGGSERHWSNIEVLESDFQDRSNENCSDND